MRILQTVVIVMAVLIFVGLGVLVWGLFNLSSKDGGAPVITEALQPAVPQPLDTRASGQISLGLPAGCEIADATVGDGRLVVRTSCGRVHILDLATLRPLGVVER